MDRAVVLHEWEERVAGPKLEDPLFGLGFDDPVIERAARAVGEGDRLRVRETRHGLAVEARAHVGVVQLGPLRVTVLPKIATEDLWYVLAYGLGLDADRRFPVEALPPRASFADILALLLLQEANALLRRGLRRGYRAQSGWLEGPRGRLDAKALAAAWPLTEASLPCAWHELSSDTLDNRVVRAGLHLARQAVYTHALRGALRQAEQPWEERCALVRLDGATLARVEHERTRLTAAYEPSHRLVTLLWSGAGMPDDLNRINAGATAMPGFLWNMATLFERFVARFLGEHVPQGMGTIDAQVPLTHLYRAVKGPGAPKTPKPRPDLMLKRDGRVQMVLDTKYRDLVARGITDGILYQLSVYGMAFGASEVAGSVPVVALYPPATAPAEDVVVELCPPGRAPIPIRVRAADWVDASRAMRETSGRARAIAERWIRVT